MDNIIGVRQALNKAYLKQSIGSEAFAHFKVQLQWLIDNVDDKETEEHNKNLVADFLKQTWYNPDYFINTKERNDLVIHTGKTAKDPVAVIIETKSPSNKTEMISPGNLNAKALQELVLYYLRERVTNQNNNLKYLLITNAWEWYLFDARQWEQLLYNSPLKKEYDQWLNNQKTSSNTDHFYKEIAKPHVDRIQGQLQYTHFNLKDYQLYLTATDAASERQLASLYKVLSPQHLLPINFANDSNSLNTRFYAELLHIMGLEETKDGGKKVIQRKAEGKRHDGSLLENTISRLEGRDRLSHLNNPAAFGANDGERLFSVALELCITWLNRILFLKLLEAQLKQYHPGDGKYLFLNKTVVPDYGVLESLFFDVLAVQIPDRKGEAAKKFAHIPYLNSSLFVPTDLEADVLAMEQLDTHLALPLHNQTVLTDATGKKLTGEQNTLQYLFDFLNAYNFSSDGTGEVQHDNKTLINASVLGLIFEKINGYKDGSFFTPGFITMYMCRETLRRAVIQKFNGAYGEKFETFEELQNYTRRHNKPAEILNAHIPMKDILLALVNK